jgi:hypothetical protein
MSKNLQIKPMQILLPVKSAGQYEVEYQKFINVNRSFNFAELAALPTEISTEWLRKLESLFCILPKDVAVFTKNLRMKKINGNNFVQLSLFLNNNRQCHCHEFQY